MPAPAADSALLVAARQLADEARERSRRAAPRRPAGAASRAAAAERAGERYGTDPPPG